MIEEGRIVHEVRYPHPIADVWQALTDPAALAAWLMPNDFSLAVGRRFRFDAAPGFGIIDAEVLEVAAPHVLRCRWTIDGTPTTVTFRLDRDGAGTILRLEHEGLAAGPGASFDDGWGHKLDHDLPLVLSGSRDRGAATDGPDGLAHHPDLEPRA